MLFSYILPAALLVVGAVSTPVELQKRAGYKCGSKTYSASDFNNCINTLCQYDDRTGPGGYPHKYNNYEGLNFGTVNGLLYEFPLTSGGAYNGGAPGADRCVADYDDSTGACVPKGAMTHTGAASKNGFVMCSAV